jgi:hypothetical protein
MTLAAWVNNSAFPANSDQRIISKATGSAEQAHYWMLSQTNVGGAQRLRFRLKTGSVTTTLVASTGDLQPNTWYHVAATYDGSTMRLYLNGVQVGSTSKTGTIATNATVPVSIGRNPEGSNYLTGTIDDVRIYNRALSSADLATVMGAPSPTNQPPSVQLTSPLPNATFAAPATIAMTATASDPENRLADVRFYAGTVLLGTDTTAPYSFTWSSVPAGTYWITAVARDLDGGTTSSFASGITVTGVAGTTPWMVAFTASADHATNVTSYLVEVFASGADPNTATPIASSDLGKPALNSLGEVIVDRTSFFEALAAGNYVMTVRAIGPGGSTRSAPYVLTR